MFKVALAVLFVAAIGMTQATPVRVRDTPQCETCKIAAGMLQSYLKDNATEEAILNFLDTQVCQTLGPLSQLCINYVNTQVAGDIEQLANMDPSALCGLFGMCPSDVRFHFPTFDCDTCKSSVQSMKNVLSDKALQDEIQSAIEQVCPFLGPYADECNTLVESYIPIFFKELVDEIDPEQTCESIGICPASFHFKEVRANPLECRLCEAVITKVEAQIGLNNTEQAIVQALEDVCQKLPSSFEPTCLSFVEVYGQYIVELLIEQLGPLQVCQTIRLC